MITSPTQVTKRKHIEIATHLRLQTGKELVRLLKNARKHVSLIRERMPLFLEKMVIVSVQMIVVIPVHLLKMPMDGIFMNMRVHTAQIMIVNQLQTGRVRERH